MVGSLGGVGRRSERRLDGGTRGGRVAGKSCSRPLLPAGGGQVASAATWMHGGGASGGDVAGWMAAERRSVGVSFGSPLAVAWR